jgi:hypothetical protein
MINESFMPRRFGSIDPLGGAEWRQDCVGMGLDCAKAAAADPGFVASAPLA